MGHDTINVMIPYLSPAILNIDGSSDCFLQFLDPRMSVVGTSVRSRSDGPQHGPRIGNPYTPIV